MQASLDREDVNMDEQEKKSRLRWFKDLTPEAQAARVVTRCEPQRAQERECVIYQSREDSGQTAMPRHSEWMLTDVIHV